MAALAQRSLCTVQRAWNYKLLNSSKAVSILRLRSFPRSSSSIWNSGWDKNLSNITPEQASNLYKASLQEPEKFWGTLGKSKLKWMQDFHTVSNSNMLAGKHEWFLGGKLNISGS